MTNLPQFGVVVRQICQSGSQIVQMTDDRMLVTSEKVEFRHSNVRVIDYFLMVLVVYHACSEEFRRADLFKRCRLPFSDQIAKRVNRRIQIQQFIFNRPDQ
jgi:hypothetical protein